MSNERFPDLERCPYCRIFMTAEQAKHHVCNSPFVAVKEIPIMFHFETQEENGDTLIIARGFNGILYRLRQCKNPLRGRKYIRRKFTEHESDEDFTEP